MANEPILEVSVATFLKAQGFGNLWSDPFKPVIFVGEEPERPDRTITILEEGGGAPVLTISETRSFIIRCLDPIYLDARGLAQQIHRALHEQQGILSPDFRDARITADTMPLPLGRDKNRRHVFTQTFTALIGRAVPTP